MHHTPRLILMMIGLPSRHVHINIFYPLCWWPVALIISELSTMGDKGGPLQAIVEADLLDEVFSLYDHVCCQ